MILKSVVRYINGPAIEATWVNEEGNNVKCRAYDKTQMDELRADLGADAVEYEGMIVECENDTTDYGATL